MVSIVTGTMSKNLKWLFLMLGIMLVTRLGIWLAYGLNEMLFLQPDSHDYVFLGKQLFAEGLFPSLSRTPVYPAFVGFLGVVLGFDVKTIILVQIAVSILTGCLAWRILKRIRSDLSDTAEGARHGNVFIIFALIFGLDFVSAQGANYLLSETFFTFLVLVAVNLVIDIKQQRSDSWAKGGLCGLVLGLAILCRPIAIFLPMVVVVWGVLQPTTQGHDKQKAFGFYQLGVFALVFVLGMSSAVLWMVRNYDRTGEVFLTTISSINLYEYRAAWNIAYRDDRPFNEVQTEFRENKSAIQRDLNLNEGEVAKRMGSEGLDLIRQTPVETMIQGGLGFLRLYFGVFSSAIDVLFRVLGSGNQAPGTLEATWVVKILVLCHLVITYFGIALLLISRFNDEKRPGESRWQGGMARALTGNSILLFCGLVIGYFTVLSVGIEAYARFRIPIMPLLAILAALGWSRLPGLVSHWRQANGDDSALSGV
ncbi:MAG: hypothetical protein GKR95_20875 [Gammaproteobacteria bacterium]|nr:hypothetical protein [Gammaproteobacteria bacterium]